MWKCVLCTEFLVCDEELLDHIRILHPDDYFTPEAWPDGDLVVEEEIENTDDLNW